MNIICGIAFMGMGIAAAGVVITVAMLLDKPFIYLYEKFDELMDKLLCF